MADGTEPMTVYGTLMQLLDDGSAPDITHYVTWMLDDPDDYDVDGIVDDYVAALAEAVRPLGLAVTRSDVYAYVDADIDDDMVRETVEMVNPYPIIFRHRVVAEEATECGAQDEGDGIG